MVVMTWLTTKPPSTATFDADEGLVHLCHWRERFVEDFLGQLLIAFGLGLHRGIRGGTVQLALLGEFVEQGLFFGTFDQGFDLLDQVGRLAGRRGRIFLEVLAQRRIAAADDGGGTADGAEDLRVPVKYGNMLIPGALQQRNMIMQ
jgi:hypothetical protein